MTSLSATSGTVLKIENPHEAQGIPLIIVGSKSALSLDPILAAWLVSARFQENTTARTTGDRAIWFKVTCQTIAC